MLRFREDGFYYYMETHDGMKSIGCFRLFKSSEPDIFYYSLKYYSEPFIPDSKTIYKDLSIGTKPMFYNADLNAFVLDMFCRRGRYDCSALYNFSSGGCTYRDYYPEIERDERIIMQFIQC